MNKAQLKMEFSRIGVLYDDNRAIYVSLVWSADQLFISPGLLQVFNIHHSWCGKDFGFFLS